MYDSNRELTTYENHWCDKSGADIKFGYELLFAFLTNSYVYECTDM